ncbi:hypothetical protein BaRGS_00034293, partial [Batillaria attramentaria]
FCHGASLVQQQKKSIDEIIMEATSQKVMQVRERNVRHGKTRELGGKIATFTTRSTTAYVTSARDREIIAAGMQEWQNYTCLQFIEADSNTRDKIRFRNGDGCYSRLGKVGGTQDISLGNGCVHLGVVIHEIGHAIGWIHEQARPDRDAFIRVNFNRIPRSWHPQFEKFPERLINYYSVPYDYRSIMHYSGNYQNVIGQREGLSYRDVKLATYVRVRRNRAKAGECSMNPGNMMMFCMKSCDFCDKGWSMNLFNSLFATDDSNRVVDSRVDCRE